MKFIQFILIITVFSIFSNNANAQTTQAGVNTAISLNHTRNFMENAGQWAPEVLFRTISDVGPIWITTNGIVYDFKKKATNKRIIGDVCKLNFAGMNNAKNLIAEGGEPISTKFNFFKGKDYSSANKSVSAYKEVIVKNIYDGVDIRYYYDTEGFRYDLIIAPNTDVSKIKFEAVGVDKIEQISASDLVFNTTVGSYEHGKIFAYQKDNNLIDEVDCRFVLADNSIQFEVKNYDKDKELVIDPLTASTLIGGSSSDYARGTTMAIDGSGNIYFTAYTWSNDFPTSVGCYDNTVNTTADIIIGRLSADFSTLDYCTYFGGDGSDQSRGIAINAGGNVYITGQSSSSDLPGTVGKYQANLAGGNDGFIAIFNASLSTLVGTTYIGGATNNEEPYDIDFDGSGNVYIAGNTSSDNFPTTAGVYSTALSGTKDCFISKFSADLTTLSASTYVGGAGSENCYEMVIATNGDVYITGETPAGYPVTAGSYDEIHNGGNDIFVSAVSSDLTTLKYSTFIGGDAGDRGEAITTDGTKIYVSGFGTTNFPTTAGAYDQTHNGTLDGVVCVLPMDLSSLTYSTYFGGANDQEYARSIAVGSDGKIYTAGYTQSTDFPTVAGAHDQSLTYAVNPQPDGFACKFSADLASLEYSTLLGDQARDYGEFIILDASDNAYVMGYTDDLDASYYPTTVGAYDVSHNGSQDIFISKLDMNIPVTVPLPRWAVVMLITTVAALGGIFVFKKIA
jgi:hypothetical protein